MYYIYMYHCAIFSGDKSLNACILDSLDENGQIGGLADYPTKPLGEKCCDWGLGPGMGNEAPRIGAFSVIYTYNGYAYMAI
jgi:hypothetical protein